MKLSHRKNTPSLRWTPGQALACILLLAFGAFAQGSYDTDYKADKNLKSNARVNPSTLAMEFTLPLMSYPGRAGNDVPVALDYSSKVWTMKHYDFLNPTVTTGVLGGSGTLQDPNRIYTITSYKPEFAERSVAGWTSAGLQPFDLKWDDRDFEYREGTTNYVYFVKRVRITMPGGSSHELRKDDKLYRCGGFQDNDNCTVTGFYSIDGIYLSVDGSGMRFEVSGSSQILYIADGSKYLISATGHTYLDRNGNKSVFDNATRKLTDTLGREIVNPAGITATAGTTSFTLPGFDTGNLTYYKTFEVLKPSGCVNGNESACSGAALENPADALHYMGNDSCDTTQNFYPLSPYLFEGNQLTYTDRSEGGGQQMSVYFRDYIAERVCSAAAKFNPAVLTEVTLPDGKIYKFRYNRYGEITKIIYPTGAYERFAYDSFWDAQQYAFTQTRRGVVDRWVSEDGVNEVQHWSYTFANGTTTTINPDDTKIVRNTFISSNTLAGFEDPRAGMPLEEKIYTAASTPGNDFTRKLLRRDLTEWIVAPARTGGHATLGVRDARAWRKISITFEPDATHALAQLVETSYDSQTDQEYFAHLNATKVRYHNFAVVALTPAQDYSLGALAGNFSDSTVAKVAESDFLYNATYKAININSLVSESRIEDAAGNAKAKTQIGYDELGFNNNGVSAQWEDPNTLYRGLVTSTKSYYDITAGLYVETIAQYDPMGNLSCSLDGRGNLSRFYYYAAYDYAYLMYTVTPVPDSNGANGSNASFVTAVTYDFNTGLPITSTDVNGQTTTMAYVDPLLRPTKVTAPNGHETITKYGTPDSNGQYPASERFVKVKSQIDATSWKEDYTWADGLGRSIRSQSVDAESGDVFSLTCYDNFGRVSKASSPFRNVSAPTCSTTTGIDWTTNTYDSNGRPWKITTPDGAFVETLYGLATTGPDIGTFVTVKDQALKERRSVTNGLGQLKRVDEPSGTSGLGAIDAPYQPTAYAYDLLNNMTTVTQIGDTTPECGGAANCTQTRTFTYDALSRLKTATNPELGTTATNGTINYTYDNNGNLKTKVDPRSITTTYTYDALNRVTLRDYSDATPDVSYFYDNLTNAKGKLVKVTNGTGADRSTTEYLAFDILGRVTRSKQTTDGVEYGGGSDQTRWMTYTYNLGGAMVEQQYPSGRVVKNVLDNTGDLAVVQSKKNTISGFWSYANSFTYNPAGAVTSMQLGNGRWESTTFNSRLQPTQIALGSTPGRTDKLDLHFTYGSTTNNGNVVSQIVTVGGTGGFTAVQNYTYDSLNRLEQADEKPLNWNQTQCTADPTKCWKQTFKFDRYGNRRFDEGNTTMPASFSNQPVSNPTVSASTNRLTSSGYNYDQAGNTTFDASLRKFTYDAENKQTKVESTNSVQVVTGTVGEYFYDGDGKRVKKYVQSSGETTIFVYDAGGKQIAEYSTIVADIASAKVAYLTNDHLGSPRVNTDSNGELISRHDYYPFGEEIAATGSRSSSGYNVDNVRKQFTGYERDGETQLDFAQARYFSAAYGRFSSPDPLVYFRITKPQSWNKYLYVLANPYRYIDSTGLVETQTECPPTCTGEEDLENYANNSPGTADVGITFAPSEHYNFGAGIQWNSNGILPYVIAGRQYGTSGINISISGSDATLSPGFSVQNQVSGLLMLRTDSVSADGSTSTGYGGLLITGRRSFIPGASTSGVYVSDAPTRDIFQRMRRLSATMATNSRRTTQSSPYLIHSPYPIHSSRAARSGLPDLVRVAYGQRQHFLIGMSPPSGSAEGKVTAICDEKGSNCEEQ